MKYYPVYLDIRNQNCLVVGAGAVGTRKVRTLLECGAVVAVVSPDASGPIAVLAEQNRIILRQRPYRASDLEGIFLVIGATDNRNLNRTIHDDARKLGILCNIADQPELCNFILPSVIDRGDLIFAISTSGKSPALAKKLRQEIEAHYGPEYGDLLKLLGAIRKILLARDHDPDAHRRIFEDLLDRGLLACIRNTDLSGIDAILESVIGTGYGYNQLMDNN